MDALPHLTVWAWERPTDLRAIDPATTAVAYLARTVWVSQSVGVVPRRQPMVIPVDTRLKLIPVTRFEVEPHARLDDAAAQMAADDVIATMRPGAAAVQIDFDARLSEREWYRKVIVAVRCRWMKPCQCTSGWSRTDGMHRPRSMSFGFANPCVRGRLAFRLLSRGRNGPPANACMCSATAAGIRILS